MHDDHETDPNGAERNAPSISRRGVLAAGSALGLGLAAGAGSASAQEEDGNGAGNAPFAAEDHDHAGDYLGEETPVDRIDVGAVVADSIGTTRVADSVAEVNQYIDEAPDRAQMSEKSGVKIVLREGTMEPDAEDLPIELKNGVVVEGQGDKVSRIDARGIGKPVFQFDRSGGPIGRAVVLRNFGVRGDGIDASEQKGVPGSKGVLFDNVHYFLIENCSFYGLEEGVVLRGCWTSTVQNLHVDQCHVDGLRYKSTERMAVNNVQISDCAIKRSGRHDINIEATERPNGLLRPAMGVALTGNDVSGAGKAGLRIVGGRGVSIDGCYTENNGGGRPLADGPDRNGDGTLNPVQISVSPDADDPPTRGLAITGTAIGKAGPNTPRDVGIKLNNVKDAFIAGNYRWWYPQGALVELGPEIENVTIRNNGLEGPASHAIVTGPLDGSSIPPHELNGGVWETAQLGGLGHIAALAAEYVDDELGNGVEVVLSEDASGSPAIDGADFPAGTLFRGVGTQAIAIESGDDAAVELARPAQGLANLNVRSDGDVGVHVAASAEKCVLSNVVANATIDVDGEGTRVGMTDAPVDTDDVSVVLDQSIDTGGLDPDSGDGSDDDGGETISAARLTVTDESPNHWRRMVREVTVNLDDAPYLGVTVPETVGLWSVAVDDGTDSAKLIDDTRSTGSFAVDIGAETGWSGEKTFELRLYAVGYDQSVTVDSIGIYESSDAETAAWEDEFDALSDSWDVRSGLDVEIVTVE